MLKKMSVIVSFALSVSALSACSSTGTPEKPKPSADEKIQTGEPATVQLAISKGWLTDEEIDKYIIDPTKKKFPNITIKLVTMDGKNVTPTTLVAAGTVPDLIIVANPTINDITSLELDDNIEPLIKKHNIDLNKFKPETLAAIKGSTGYDYLVGLPYAMHFSALYYNKDLFNKFGVPFPKDGMTWDEVTELARKMTRLDNGVQYRGLEPDHVTRPASQLSLGLIDPKTMKTTVNSEQWKKVFTTLKNIYDIPGNNQMQNFNNASDQFAKDKTLAMRPELNVLGRFAAVKDLNWDLVTYPTFKETPNTGMQVDEHILAITRTSKVKDAAMDVISVVVSDEVQLTMAGDAKVSTLKDDKFIKEFGKNVDYVKGKNMEAVLRMKQATPVAVTKYDKIPKDRIQNAMESVVKGQEDINTALRTAEEEINNKLATETKK
ncbi:extracellular solute-binding protein [Paenibacillus filicis]|uniref:Extracellular solute-binding protein n=1 Tax=Paenibacillus gyeongsangnamensis TaxID=3388067 RepID=A0ABT4QJ66_9BACL|nr:extracellular solute-binding protein [Paenibacillus filicis]MCZ8516890.1 extracellular solute-binding protein [Paenibacillus filicis]